MNKFLLSALLACTAASGYAESWMTNIPDNTPMRRMSLPGAHDAAAQNLTIGKTQDLSLDALWDAGVRAFDLRPTKDLMIYHGSAPTGVTMEEAFTIIENKLAVDKDDFAFLMVKKEDSSTEWAANVGTFLAAHDASIVPFRANMTLKEARGKIVVVTRDAVNGFAKAGFAGNWGDNQVFKTGFIEGNGSREDMLLQDYYDYSNDRAGKITGINRMFRYAGSFNEESKWAVNFTSGYKKNLLGYGDNDAISDNAKACNQAAADILNDPTSYQGRTGIVFMDYAGVENGYAGQQLIDAVIARNTIPQAVAIFARDRANWVKGPEAGNFGYMPAPQGYANEGKVQIIETYRDDKFPVGTIMEFNHGGLPNGTYVANIVAHANYTPGRNKIQTAAAPAEGHGYSQLVVNDNTVSLPVHYNTALPAYFDIYSVPFTVTDGRVNIKMESVKPGANWFTIYVSDIYRYEANVPCYFKHFDGDVFDWKPTYQVKNNCRKWLSDVTGGGLNDAAYENWGYGPHIGKLYNKQHVLNGRYRVDMTVHTDVVDGDKIYYYVNNVKTPLQKSEDGAKGIAYSTEVDVTDGVIEFGVGFDEGTNSNWVWIDDPTITPLQKVAFNELPMQQGNDSYEVEEAEGTVPAFAVAKPAVDANYKHGVNYSIVDANNAVVNTPITEADGNLSFAIANRGAYTLKAASVGTIAHNPTEVTVPLAVYVNPGLGFNVASAEANIAEGTATFKVDAAKFANAECTNEVTYAVTDATGAPVAADVVAEGDKVSVSFAASPADYTLTATSPRGNHFTAGNAKMTLAALTTSGIEGISATKGAETWYDIYGNKVAPENLGTGVYIRVNANGATKVVR